MSMKTSRDIQKERIAESSIRAKALLYWQISQARQGRGPLAGASTEYAIGLLSDLEAATSWETILGKAVTDLLDAVIGRSKRKYAVKEPQGHKYYKKYLPPEDDWDGPPAA